MGQYTTSSFPLLPGMSEGQVDEKVLPPGQPYVVKNARFTKSGAVQKRWGMTRYAPTITTTGGLATLYGTAYATAERVFPAGSGLCMVGKADGNGTAGATRVLSTWDPELGIWAPMQPCPTMVATAYNIDGDMETGKTGAIACAVNDRGHVAVAWVDGTTASVGVQRSLRFAVYDENMVPLTVAPLGNSLVTIATGGAARLRMVACGSQFVLLYCTAANDIRAFVWDGTTSGSGYVGFTQTNTLITAIPGAYPKAFDAVSLSSTQFFLAYVSATLATVAKITASTLATASTIQFDVCDIDISCSVAASGGTTYGLVVYANAGGAGSPYTKAHSFNASTMVAVAQQDIDVAAARQQLGITPTSSTGTGAVVTYRGADVGSASTIPVLACASYTYTSAVAPSTTTLQNQRVVSKPFYIDGEGALVIVSPGLYGSDVSQFIVTKVPGWYPVSTFAVRDVAVPSGGSAADIVGVATKTAGSKYIFPGSRNMSSSDVFAPAVWELNAADTSRWLWGEHANYTVVGGGVPSVCDGSTLKEVGFLADVSLTALSTVGVGALPAGTYSYIACVTYGDRRGNMHRSAPSVAVSGTLGGAGRITVDAVVPSLSSGYFLTYTVEMYRTTAGGSTFYLLDSTTNRYTPNSGTGFMTIADVGAVSDATLITNPQLYTTGTPSDVLTNEGCSSARCIAVWRNRVAIAGGDDAGLIWFSKEYLPGEAPAVNDAAVVRCDDAGLVRALAVMDERLIVFAVRGIFEVVGSPYNDNGIGDLTVQKVSVETTCLDGRSVVSTPLGIMFQSPRGICLLDRTGTVQEIGWPVKDQLATYTSVTSAVHVETDARVMFSATNVDNSGVLLAYDYKMNAWSVQTLENTEASKAVASACEWNGAYVAARYDGYSYQESSLVWQDGGTSYALYVQTGWFTLLGLGGFYRARRVGVTGKWKTAHGLTLTVDYDYSTSLYTATTQTWVSADLQAIAEKPKMRLGTQKVDAVRLKITEVAHSTPSTSDTLELTGVTVEWMPKRGMVKQAPAAQK